MPLLFGLERKVASRSNVQEKHTMKRLCILSCNMHTEKKDEWPVRFLRCRIKTDFEEYKPRLFFLVYLQHASHKAGRLIPQSSNGEVLFCAHLEKV